MESKICCTCKIEKSEEEFYRRSDTGKLKSDCKFCYNEKVAARKTRDPELAASRSRINAMRHYDKHHRVEPKEEIIYPEPTEVEKAYLAGIFDGEGSIGVKLSIAGSLVFWMHIVNTDYPVLELFQKFYGGQIYARKLIMGHKQIYQYTLGGINAVVFAQGLYPYVMIKRDQVEAFIEAWEQFSLHGSGLGRKGVKLTTNEIETRREYVERLKDLKK